MNSGQSIDQGTGRQQSSMQGEKEGLGAGPVLQLHKKEHQNKLKEFNLELALHLLGKPIHQKSAYVLFRMCSLLSPLAYTVK
jgi:hypothetical protein